MIRLDPLAFLLIVQFCVVFAILCIFLYMKYRKVSFMLTQSREEARRLHDDAVKREETVRGQISDREKWKSLFASLESKFTAIKEVNAKLKESIARLIPEAERSKEYEQLIADIEKSNKELDTCIATLSKEKEALIQMNSAMKGKADELSQKLQDSVSKDEFDRLVAQKDDLEANVHSLTEQLNGRAREYENLQKNFAALEKEYNALYRNIEETQGDPENVIPETENPSISQSS